MYTQNRRHRRSIVSIRTRAQTNLDQLLHWHADFLSNGIECFHAFVRGLCQMRRHKASHFTAHCQKGMREKRREAGEKGKARRRGGTHSKGKWVLELAGGVACRVVMCLEGTDDVCWRCFTAGVTEKYGMICPCFMVAPKMATSGRRRARAPSTPPCYLGSVSNLDISFLSLFSPSLQPLPSSPLSLSSLSLPCSVFPPPSLPSLFPDLCSQWINYRMVEAKLRKVSLLRTVPSVSVLLLKRGKHTRHGREEEEESERRRRSVSARQYR